MNKPSEKAMRLADKLSKRVHPVYNEHYHGWRFDKENTAVDIDTYTAEVLSEHKRVLVLVEQALATLDEAERSMPMGPEAAKHKRQQMRGAMRKCSEALAAIAELKTNEKPNA